MLFDFARLWTSKWRSRRAAGINTKSSLIELLENRSLLSTVEILTPIVGSAKVTATDKGDLPRAPPQTRTATWGKTGQIHPISFNEVVMATSGGASGATVAASKGTGKNPSLSIATSIGMSGSEWSATAESGSGVRMGDPINLRIVPEEGESPGTRVLVTLTVTGFRGTAAFTHAFHTEYHFENETHTIASGTLSRTTLTKTVTFEAEIGDDFDIAFSLEGSTTSDSPDGNATIAMFVKAEPVKVDLVPKSLAWDATKGGLSFKYAINEGSLPATKPPKVELFWAAGTKTIGNAIALSGFKPATKQGEYSFNVAGKQLRTVPKGATHLVLVLDRLNTITETNEENNKKSIADVAIQLGKDVSGVVHVKTLEVLKRLQRDAGQTKITITDLERTPLRQAQIMFQNCLTQGAASQLALYKDPGDQVIQVYIDQTKGLNKTQIASKKTAIVNLMLKKILTFKPLSQVSHHIVDGNDLQVVDIAPSSFASTATLNRFITSAIEARNAGLVSYIIRPGVGEKALHLEIPQ